jgi:uncharacterized protein YodC (DUF2158 family)
MSFKVGDTVQLKSGGEMMTIEEVDGDSANCVWFVNQKLKEVLFI